jgi:hypothetical protein
MSRFRDQDKCLEKFNGALADNRKGENFKSVRAFLTQLFVEGILSTSRLSE